MEYIEKMEETDCEVICGALTTPAFKGWVKVVEDEVCHVMKIAVADSKPDTGL